MLLNTVAELRDKFGYNFLVDIFASHHPTEEMETELRTENEPQKEAEIQKKKETDTGKNNKEKHLLQKEFRLHYHLHNMQNKERLLLRLRLARSDLHAPSVTSLYSAANWLERETYDFYGIVFTGHPDLRRILNMYEMTDFPLRKEFPLEDPTREDKENKYFGR